MARIKGTRPVMAKNKGTRPPMAKNKGTRPPSRRARMRAGILKALATSGATSEPSAFALALSEHRLSHPLLPASWLASMSPTERADITHGLDVKFAYDLWDTMCRARRTLAFVEALEPGVTEAEAIIESGYAASEKGRTGGARRTRGTLAKLVALDRDRGCIEDV